MKQPLTTADPPPAGARREGGARPPQTLDHRATITQRLAAKLKDQILAGAYAPGAALREGELVAQFDVSRHVIREVLRTLAADGLVDYSSFKGARVPVLTEANARDIYRVRRMLECGSETMTPLPDPGAINRIHRQFAAAVRAGAWARAFELDLEFHGAIVAAAGSPRLCDWHRGLLQDLRLAHLVAPAFNQPAWEASVAQHAQIAAAIQAGDAPAARLAMRHHLDDAEALLLGDMTAPV
jgi:DNA-binding GntR family transcriptional regulator